MNAMVSSQCKISLATPFLARKNNMKTEHCTVKGPTLVTSTSSNFRRLESVDCINVLQSSFLISKFILILFYTYTNVKLYFAINYI